ncbi:MAG: putative MATE family efflux protein [Gammaproteobacteria bacterium]|jgi:putative MATE family efflux protein
MQHTDLTQGDEKRHLIDQTIPMIWGLLAIMSMSLVDTWFIAQLGIDEVAAVGFSFPIIIVLSSLAFGVGTGASSVISRAIGEGDHSRVASYTTHAILIAFLIGIFFAIIGSQTIDMVFHALGAEDRLLPLIHDYMDIWYFGCFLIVVPMVGNSAIRAAGNSKIAAYVMISMALVNIVLDPIFIFGLFGFPRLELQGAALATMTAYFVSFLVSIYVLKVRLNMIGFDACVNRVRESWIAILRLAIPAAITNMVTPLSSVVALWMIAKFGSVAVAGFSIATRIESLLLLVLMSLSAVIAPFVGQNWGAGFFHRVRRAAKLGYSFSFIWGFVVAVLLILTATPLVKFFNDDLGMLDAAVTYLYVIPITYGFLGVTMIASSVANGVGDPIPALVISIMRLLVIFVPLALVLLNYFGLAGIYAAIAGSNVLVGVGAMIWTSRRCRDNAAIA